MILQRQHRVPIKVITEGIIIVPFDKLPCEVKMMVQMSQISPHQNSCPDNIYKAKSPNGSLSTFRMSNPVMLQHVILINVKVPGITIASFEALPRDIEMMVKISQVRAAKYIITDNT